MFFIFIGGASASGKTGVSDHLLNKLMGRGVKVQKLNMDDYYHERPDNVDIDYFRANTNFDTPKMLHLELFQSHIDDLSKGKAITKPKFSFLTNKRVGEEKIEPSDLIIVEGIFAQYFYQRFISPEIPALSVNVSTAEHKDIVERRVVRDMKTRNRTKDEVIAQEQLYVAPGFFQYTASHATGADLYINNKKHDDVEEQNKELDRVAEEIIAAYLVKNEAMTKGSVTLARVKKPDVREIIAKSHMQAGNCEARLFTGFFSGAFGGIAGTYQEQFAEEAPSDALTLN